MYIYTYYILYLYLYTIYIYIYIYVYIYASYLVVGLVFLGGDATRSVTAREGGERKFCNRNL